MSSGQLGWPVSSSTHFLPPGPPIDSLEAQTNRIPLAALLKDGQDFIFFKEHNHWPVSGVDFPYFRLPFFGGSFQQVEEGDLHNSLPGRK